MSNAKEVLMRTAREVEQADYARGELVPAFDRAVARMQPFVSMGQIPLRTVQAELVTASYRATMRSIVGEPN